MASLGDYPKRRYAQICPALKLVVGHYHPVSLVAKVQDFFVHKVAVIVCRFEWSLLEGFVTLCCTPWGS